MLGVRQIVNGLRRSLSERGILLSFNLLRPVEHVRLQIEYDSIETGRNFGPYVLPFAHHKQARRSNSEWLRAWGERHHDQEMPAKCHDPTGYSGVINSRHNHHTHKGRIRICWKGRRRTLMTKILPFRSMASSVAGGDACHSVRCF